MRFGLRFMAALAIMLAITAATAGIANAEPLISAAQTDVDVQGGQLVVVLFGVARWVAFMGLALLVGATFFTVACWQAGAADRRVRAMIWSGWASVVVATAAATLLYGPYIAGLSLSSVTDWSLLSAALGTPLGQAMTVRLVMLGVFAIGLWFLLARIATATGANRWVVGGVLVGAGALAATWSSVTHSATRGGVIGVPADLAHLVAMGVWLGGVVVLAGALLPSKDIDALRVALPRFSTVALISIGLITITGVYTGWRQVETIPAMIDTSYGNLLLAKAALVAVIVAVAAMARSWTRAHFTGDIPLIGKRKTQPRPRISEVRQFRQWVAAEAGIAVVVLVVTTLLVNAEPAHVAYARQEGERAKTVPQQANQAPGTGAPTSQPARAAASTKLPFDSGVGPAGKGTVGLAVVPDGPGGTVHVDVYNAIGTPRDVTDIRAELSLADPAINPIVPPLIYGGPGHYISNRIVIPKPGSWKLTLSFKTTGSGQATVSTSVEVRG